MTPARESLAARAQSRIAQITRVIGSPGEAIWQFKNAVTREEALVKRHPGDPQYQDDLIHTLTDLADVLLTVKGKREEALSLFKRAGQWIEPKNASQAVPESRRRELIRVLGGIAQIERETNQAEQARESLERALELASIIAAKTTATLDDQITLASTQAALGRLLMTRQPTLDQAEKLLTKGIDLRETITRSIPNGSIRSTSSRSIWVIWPQFSRRRVVSRRLARLAVVPWMDSLSLPAAFPITRLMRPRCTSLAT